MENKKMTYRSAIEFVLEQYTVPEEVESKLKALVESLDKKSKGAKKETARQKENSALSDEIISNMFGRMCITDIIKACPSLSEMSATPQRVAPIMAKLVEGGVVTVNKVKGRNYYELVEGE